MSTFKNMWGFCPRIPKWAWGVLSVGCFVLQSVFAHDRCGIIDYMRLPIFLSLFSSRVLFLYAYSYQNVYYFHLNYYF